MAKNKDKFFNKELAKVNVQPVVEEKAAEPVAVPEEIKEPEVVEEPVQEEVVKEIQEPVENVVDAVIDGVDVSLNIRKEPEVKPNNQIAILGKGVKIKVVDPEKPVKNTAGEWYKIRIVDAQTKEESNGFAMKKYIKII